MDRLTPVRLAADVGGGNITGNVFEQINGGFVELRDDLRRRLSLFFCIGPRYHVRRNDEAEGFRAYARAVGDDEITKREQGFIFLPHGDIQECVGANDEKEPVTVVNVTKITHGVHGIVKLRAAEILTGFGKRGNEVGMFSASERNHSKAVGKRREVLLQLVRRPARGNEVEFVEIETPVGGAGDGKMAVVDWVKRTAENRDAARMMFCGSAVRLRGGQ